eukprot:gene21750-1245_t
MEYLANRLLRDPDFRSDYYYKRIHDMTSDFVAISQTRKTAVDTLLQEVENTQKNVKMMFLSRLDWMKIGNKVLERGIGDCPICMQPVAAIVAEDGSVVSIR